MKKPAVIPPPVEILEPGQPNPGGWVETDPSLREWIGPDEWKTRHGPAFCAWRRGRPWFAENVLLPDGARGRVRHLLFGPVGHWRRPETQTVFPPDGWIIGIVRLSNVDAIFIDCLEQPAIEPPVDWGYPDLECDLWKSPDIRRRCQERGFAMALYAALAYYEWYQKSGGVWHCTLGGAGWVVAAMRGRGEDYLDYKCRDDRKVTRPHEADVTAALARIGWFPVGAKNMDAIEGHAHRILAEWEGRPDGPLPAWYTSPRVPKNRVASTRMGSLLKRIHELTIRGKISEAEWRMVFSLLHAEWPSHSPSETRH